MLHRDPAPHAYKYKKGDFREREKNGPGLLRDIEITYKEIEDYFKAWCDEMIKL